MLPPTCFHQSLHTLLLSESQQRLSASSAALIVPGGEYALVPKPRPRTDAPRHTADSTRVLPLEGAGRSLSTTHSASFANLHAPVTPGFAPSDTLGATRGNHGWSLGDLRGATPLPIGLERNRARERLPGEREHARASAKGASAAAAINRGRSTAVSAAGKSIAHHTFHILHHPDGDDGGDDGEGNGGGGAGSMRTPTTTHRDAHRRYVVQREKPCRPPTPAAQKLDWVRDAFESTSKKSFGWSGDWEQPHTHVPWPERILPVLPRGAEGLLQTGDDEDADAEAVAWLPGEAPLTTSQASFKPPPGSGKRTPFRPKPGSNLLGGGAEDDDGGGVDGGVGSELGGSALGGRRRAHMAGPAAEKARRSLRRSLSHAQFAHPQAVALSLRRQLKEETARSAEAAAALQALTGPSPPRAVTSHAALTRGAVPGSAAPRAPLLDHTAGRATMESVRLQYSSSVGELMAYNGPAAVDPSDAQRVRTQRGGRPREVGGRVLVPGQLERKPSLSIEELREMSRRRSAEDALPFVPSRRSI